jgi:serine protease Do
MLHGRCVAGGRDDVAYAAWQCCLPWPWPLPFPSRFRQRRAGRAAPKQSRALERAANAVVGLQVAAVEGARSATTLGKARQGSGVVIDRQGLVLTIGYLILEADQVLLITDDQRRIPARVVAYDLATGFGLVRALAPLQLDPAPLGLARAVATPTR